MGVSERKSVPGHFFIILMWPDGLFISRKILSMYIHNLSQNKLYQKLSPIIYITLAKLQGSNRISFQGSVAKSPRNLDDKFSLNMKRH